MIKLSWKKIHYCARIESGTMYQNRQLSNMSLLTWGFNIQIKHHKLRGQEELLQWYLWKSESLWIEDLTPHAT